MAKKTSFCVKLLVALCLCLGMAGGLLAQPGLSVTISGTLAPYISGSGEITSAKYVSGITATGAKGSYCLIDFNGGTTTAEAEVLLSSANTPSVGNIIAGDFKSFGSGYSYTSPPTTATVIAGGTATCNVGGTAVVSAKIDDPVGLEGATFDATTTFPTVGITYSSSGFSAASLPITFIAGGFQLTCPAATVAVSIAGDGSGTLKVTECTFTLNTTSFSATVLLPAATFPAPVPVAFSASIAAGSSGTYETGSGTFPGDSTTLGISSASISATCSDCPSLIQPGPIALTAQTGGSATPQSVPVNSSPAENEAFAVTASSSGNWLTISGPSGGQIGGTFKVGANAASLGAGNYSGTVNVYSAATNSPLPVTVNLTVTAPSFILVAAPSTFAFNSVNSAAPPSQTLAVTTSPSSSVPFTATSNQSWLTVNGGSTAGGTTGGAAIAVAANPNGMSAGTYTGTITLAASGATNSGLQLTVTLNVTTVPTPSPLTFVTSPGVNPPSQPLNVTSTAGPPASYTAAVTSGSSWLSVSPGSFTTNAGGPTVSVNVGALNANTTGTITLTFSGGAQIQVTVNLTFLPSLVAGSSPLNLTYSPGSTPSTTLGITSSGTAISYTVAVSTTTGGAWLQASGGGTTPGNVAVTIVTGVASTLATGTYSGAVLVSCTPSTSCGNANGQLSVPVNLTVTAALTAAPSPVQFNYTILGATPAPVPIAVTSNGGAIAYTAAAATTSGGNWLAVSPGSFTTPTGVTASVIPSALTGLAAGTYNGSITLTSTGASNSPLIINATLVVSAALGASSNSFTFAYQTGGSAPVSQPLTITSNGAALTFAAAASTTSGGPWLSVSPTSGTTGTTGNLTVSTVPSVLSTLAAGTYIGSIAITSAQAGNSPLNITVTLTVSTLPSLTPLPSSLLFNYTVGGTVPSLPPVTVGSNGTAFNNVTTATATPWLQVSQNGSSTPFGMTVSLVQANLPTTAGSYQGSVTITASGAANSPLSYPVTLTVSAQPSLTVGPSPLAFTGQVGGANPGPQTLSVASTNGSVNFTVTHATASGNWLSVTPTIGTTNASLQVTVNTTGLAIGNYSGSVTVTASGASGSPAVIPVSLAVTSLPNLIATPSTLAFSYLTGAAAPAGMSVAVSTSNSASAAFSVSTSTTSGGSSWLQVSPPGGTSPASFVANIVPGSLTAGTYTGTITVSATGFTSTTVAVTLVVTQPKATIQITGSAVFVLANSAAPVTNTLAISSSDGSAQPFTIAEGSSPNNWLTLSATSGTTPANVKLTANPAGLTPGVYVIPITVTMPALPVPTKTILAQLSITGSNLVASPGMLTFTYQPGLPLPAAQTVSLTTASGSGSVALSSITTNVPWLKVTPASNVPAMLQVSINPAPLTAGTFTGAILVTATGSPDVSLQIPVTITVDATPQLTATPVSLAFNYQIGGAAPASQSFALASGTVPVTFAATSPGNWLQLSPLRGTTPGSVLVTANPAGLPAGTYGGTIAVSTFGVTNPVSVAVTLVVSAPPQLTFAPSQLTFTVPVGGAAPVPQTLTVTSNDGPLAFTAASGSIWLGVTPTSGTTPATLAVSVNPAGLATGVYTGTINITQAGSAVPQMILVTLQVGNVTPTIVGVINAASGAIGTVAPGMAISIFGSVLGPQPGVGFAAPPEGGTVLTTLAGTQVLFDGVPAPVLFTLTGQVNALAPFELSSKTSTVLQVVYNGVTSAAMTLPVVPAEPGLFAANASGKGEGAILNQDGITINSASNPAAAGSTIQLFGTGGGVTVPPSIDGALNPMSSTGALALVTTATVGGQPATVLYAGPAPNLVSGIIQINVTLPSGTPSGNVPVIVTIGCPSAPLLVPAACAGFPGYTASSQTTITVAVQ